MDEDGRVNPKVSGYLEKKGKMKMMSSYKRYWFVLEGRLLLYYRSKDEYKAISPCKGSINLGPPCNVKPCPALPGVFQIETRTSTTTLRAEDREDQNRWMQGIMSALNQNKNSTKLSHFRYSLDETPEHQVNKSKLQSHNSLPPPASSKNQCHEGIIRRLQKMGAHSYGGSVGTINQIANSKKAENINNSNSTESLQYTPVDLTAFSNNVLIENDQYEVFKENDGPQNVEIRSRAKAAENIYERISRDSIVTPNGNKEVNYSIPNKKTESKDTAQSHTSHTSVDQENILRKIIEKKDDSIEDLDKASTFLLENEIYGTAKTDIDQKDQNDVTRKSVVLENDNYCSVDKIRYSNDSSEEIYAEPKCTDFTDHNENNLVLSNAQNWSKIEENAYSVTTLDDPENDKITNPCEYEYLDTYGEYTEPSYQTTEDIYAECTEKSTTKPKKEKKKKSRKDDTDNEKKEMKLKKTSSFIKRVWKKKYKHKKTEESIDELYETVPATVVEKVAINDQTTVQMLSELHSILEHKKPILKERLSTEIKPDKKADERPKDKKTATNVNTSISPTRDETTVQMLSELQNILENKKNVLTGRTANDKDLPVDKANPQNNLIENENKITANVNDEGGSTSKGSEKIYPSLPLKPQKIDVDSPYHDVPKNNQPINKILPPKKKQSSENVKSLDDILNDLDKEKTDDFHKNNVKKLIKQFSDSEFNENDENVILRTNKENDQYREDTDTDELSRLLEELAKVTCAPILTPGVTTSLINPHITDEELLKLLPTRRRRYSEPDYDIPRPHKSLTNLPKKEHPPEGVIGSTRFFGPILQPSDVNIKTNNMKSSEDIPSMTPDSLELETHMTTCLRHLHSPEDEKTSYTSHNYIQLKHYTTSIRNNEDCITGKNLSTNNEMSMKYFDNILIENDIYAQPKSLHNLNAIKVHKISDHDHHLSFKGVKHKSSDLAEDKLEENFVDSLEI